MFGFRTKIVKKLKRFKARFQPKGSYNEDYFLEDCSGAEEFLQSKGKKLIKRFQVALNLVQIKKGMRVLDIGSGRGEVAHYCHQQGAEVIGLDFSQEAIKIARRTYPQVLFVQQDIFQYQPKVKFSLIMMLDFVEHIPQTKFKTLLKQSHQWLKKNGQLLIHTNEKNQEERPGVPFHPSHINLMTAKELRNILQNSGFKIKKFILRPRKAKEASGGIYCLAEKK